MVVGLLIMIGSSLFALTQLNKKPVVVKQPAEELPEELPVVIPDYTPACGPLQIGGVLAHRQFHDRGVQLRVVQYPVKNVSDFEISGIAQITSFDHLNGTLIDMHAQGFSFVPGESKFMEFGPKKYMASKRAELGFGDVNVPYNYQIDFVLSDGSIIAQVMDSFP